MYTIKQKICIICREQKNHFNKEHVVPSTLGGGFIIDLVCCDCNKLLGDRIDTPFVNHRLILLYRHHFNLSRQGRSIKTPFEGVFKDRHGNDFIVGKSNGKFTGEYLPKFAISDCEQGLMATLTVSAKLMESDPNFLEKYKCKFENETGYTVNHHSLEKFVLRETLVAEAVDSDNKIILGCLKMVYEFSVASIPEYFNDEIAIAFSDMLRTGLINRDFAEYLVPKLSLAGILDINLQKYPELKEHHIIVMIEQVNGVGLVGCIKLFDESLAFLLSTRQDYLDERVLLLLNDSINKEARCTFLKNPFSISIDFGYGAETERPIIDSTQPVRFYNSDNIVSYILDECTIMATYMNFDYRSIAKCHQIVDEVDGLFIKCSVSDKLYPITSMTLNFK